MRISDWSSDVCSSDLCGKGKGKDAATVLGALAGAIGGHMAEQQIRATNTYDVTVSMETGSTRVINVPELGGLSTGEKVRIDGRSEEHTSELQSLMRISYAVFCLKKKNKKQKHTYMQEKSD